jgi:diguanylate cyclase (GGDEF)-like protein
METELLLWRWSVGVQWASLAMITVFFAALARSGGWEELRSWVLAWAADLVALGVSFVYWHFQPEGLLFNLTAAAYMAAKTAFVLLFLQGERALRRPGAPPVPLAQAAPVLVGYSLTGFLLPNVLALGVVQQLVTGVLFAVGGGLLLRRPREVGFAWLGGAMLFRAALSLVQSAFYAVTLAPASVSEGFLQGVRSFLAAHSFVDALAEWLLALAAVLALSDRVQRALHQYNRDLLTAQEELRRLADRDPLTALDNRRSLPEIFRTVQPQGALLLFFDLDGFKALNDRHGHQVGDECLKRFAAGLRECFRPGDALVRYAGDEFLVVASGIDAAAARERVARLRERLAASAADGPRIAFSVGVAELPPGGQPDAALKAADEAMYRAKAVRPGKAALTPIVP